MNPLLYDELVPFYHLLDPLEDHEDEAEAFGKLLREAAPGGSLLELGAGAGHGAYFVKERFEHVALCDISTAMLARSQALNSDCEHVPGDMRSYRGSGPVDAILIHDAISYIASVAELKATAKTVVENLRPGGAALLVPDCTKESFKESHEDHAGDDAERSLRCISWSYDPDSSDDTHVGDFAFLLREHGAVRAVHDRHIYGLFSRDVWVQVLSLAGLQVEVVSRWLPKEYLGMGYTEEMFLCRKLGKAEVKA